MLFFCSIGTWKTLEFEIFSLSFCLVVRKRDALVEHSLVHDENICLQETVTRRDSVMEHIRLEEKYLVVYVHSKKKNEYMNRCINRTAIIHRRTKAEKKMTTAEKKQNLHLLFLFNMTAEREKNPTNAVAVTIITLPPPDRTRSVLLVFSSCQTNDEYSCIFSLSTLILSSNLNKKTTTIFWMLKWYYTNSSKEMTVPYACFQANDDDKRHLITYWFLIIKQRLNYTFLCTNEQIDYFYPRKWKRVIAHLFKYMSDHDGCTQI